MTRTAEILAPHVQYFSGRQDSFIQCGSVWHRLTPEDAARSHTVYDRETREPSVGVYVERRPNGLLRIGFDLWKLNANLRPAVIERLENRWRQEAASLSKPMLRSVSRRAHFSKSFMRFEVAPEWIEEWTAELSAVLENPDSYESVESRTAADA